MQRKVITQEQIEELISKHRAEGTVPLSDILTLFNNLPHEVEDIKELRRDNDMAYKILAVYGVPRERARHLSNGIDVLSSRFQKRIQELTEVAEDYRRRAKKALDVIKYHVEHNTGREPSVSVFLRKADEVYNEANSKGWIQ